MVEGRSEWPPAPARLFQALVAGAARGRTLPEPKRAALEWLEALPAPVIGAPPARLGERVVFFVPNNDADSLSDPTEVGSIRTKKVVHPRIPDPGPLLYAWAIHADPDGHATRIAEAADDLFQLGRGVDMAWASGEVLGEAAFSARLARFEGEVHVPNAGRQGVLPCPTRGTLRSLLARHSAPRLTVEGTGRQARTYFTNPPKPFFVGVAYLPEVRRLLYDLRRANAPERPAPGRPSDVVQLVERIRDAAASRLTEAMPDKAAAINRCLIGRKPDGTSIGPPELRVRIVPLLSIGFEHADRGVRRVVLEIPSGAPLRADDVAWAFNGLEVIAADTSDSVTVLLPSDDRDMLDKHYVPSSQRWRSVTPVALPEEVRRRRIEPSRRIEEAKSGAERAQEEFAAMRAVVTALRHAGVRARATSIRVQREPFEAKGQRAEAFERKPRFPKERLWHVALELERSVEGPLVLGDGRFLGLGVMAPDKVTTSSMYAFRIDAGASLDPLGLARALRRAVMSRAKETLGRSNLGRFLSGHEPNGAPAREGSHLAFHFDPLGTRLLVIAPHVLERREADCATDELQHLQSLERALAGFNRLVAGHLGEFTLKPVPVDDQDPLCAPARAWTSLTPYTVSRHGKRLSPEAVLTADVQAECARRGLPRPSVRVLTHQGVPGRGLTAMVELLFQSPLRGPIALGRTRLLGGGLFVGAPRHRGG